MATNYVTLLFLTMSAGGKSLSQLQTELTRMLAAGYLRDPQVWERPTPFFIPSGR